MNRQYTASASRIIPDRPGPLGFSFILPQRSGTDINATVDVKDLPGHPAGLVAGQVEGGVGDVFRPAGAGQSGYWLHGAFSQRLSEQPGANTVNPNVVGVEFFGQALAQADDATFGCTVSRIAGLLKIHP